MYIYAYTNICTTKEQRANTKSNNELMQPLFGTRTSPPFRLTQSQEDSLGLFSAESQKARIPSCGGTDGKADPDLAAPHNACKMKSAILSQKGCR